AMPCRIQPVDLGFRQPLDAESRQQLVEHAPMEAIDIGPRQFRPSHAIHRRPVAGAPGIREGSPIDFQPLALGQRLTFADQAAAPVHDRSEYIEQQRAYTVQRHGMEKADKVRERLYGWVARGQSRMGIPALLGYPAPGLEKRIRLLLSESPRPRVFRPPGCR